MKIAGVSAYCACVIAVAFVAGCKPVDSRATMAFPVRNCSVVYADGFDAAKGSDAWGRSAAQDLAMALGKVTGTDIDVCAESKATSVLGRVIYVGPVKAAASLNAAALRSCDFRIRVEPNRVFVLGRTETGSAFGVTEFLERFCGYRFLTQSGDDPYVANPALKVPVCDFTDRCEIYPHEIYRRSPDPKLRPKTMAAWHDYYRRRRVKFLECEIEPQYRVSDCCDKVKCHTTLYYCPPEKYLKDHPEYYAMQKDGTRNGRRNPQGGQLCYTHPGTYAVVREHLLAYIAKDRRERPSDYPLVYDITHQDNTSTLCLCPECKKVIAKYNRVKGGNREGGDMGLQLEFVNRLARDVARTYPDVFLRIFAYVSTEERPKGIVPEKNVIVWMCDPYAKCDHMLPLEHPFNAPQAELIRGWKSCAERVQIWDYMLYQAAFPEVNVDAIAADAKFFRSLGNVDLFMESEFWEQPFYELNLYAMDRLYRHPDTDVETLIDEFCTVYGRAAPEMRRAIDFLRKLARENPPPTTYAWHERILPYRTAENFRTLKGLLEKAHAAAETPDIRARIAQVLASTCRELCRIYRGEFGAEASYRATKEELRKFAKEDALRELADPKARAAAVAAVDEDLDLEDLRFRDLPPELEKVAPDRLVCLDWRKRRINNQPKLVDDPAAESGKAALYAPSTSSNQPKPPIPCGVYDATEKRMIAKWTITPQEKAEGAYRWYRMGDIRIGMNSYFWMTGLWKLQAYFQHLYVNCDGAPVNLNDYELWVSLKFEGPSYYPGSGRTDGIWFDRVALRRR